MKLTKLEETIKEIAKRNFTIMGIPSRKGIKEILSLIETRERVARTEGYEEGFKDGEVVITGQTGGTTYTSDGRAR